MRPVFRAILIAAAREDPALLTVAIVTFSGQKDLIRQVLESVLGKSAAGRIPLRTARRDWAAPASYVPPRGGLPTGKEPHIASVVEEMFNNRGEVVCAEQVMLIDDDVKNIICAQESSHKSVLFPAMPLPGIHMKSPVMEGSGVRVLRRCQLAHGAILCVSSGSVVNFAAPGLSGIVNAANNRGLGGGGVDGAISAAGGEELLAARMAWPQDSEGQRIPTGECRVTGPGPFGRLQVLYVLHTAGPDYDDIADRDRRAGVGNEADSLQRGDELLAASYRNCMRCAQECRLELLALPLVSAGVFRGSQSLQAVLSIAVDAITEGSYEGLREVHLVAFSGLEEETLLDVVAAGLEGGAALQRGAGGEEQIVSFLDAFEKSALSGEAMS